MADSTDPTTPPATEPTPPPPTLHELAGAVEDAEAVHDAAETKSNASKAQADLDQKAESDAHGALLTARDALITAAKQIT